MLIDIELSFFPAPAISVQVTPSGDPVLGQSGYSLICDVTGTENLNPSIIYQWTKNNGTLTQIQNVEANSEVLSFSPLRLSDAGQYTCQATVNSPKYLTNDITEMNSQYIMLQSELSSYQGYLGYFKIIFE